MTTVHMDPTLGIAVPRLAGCVSLCSLCAHVRMESLQRVMIAPGAKFVNHAMMDTLGHYVLKSVILHVQTILVKILASTLTSGLQICNDIFSTISAPNEIPKEKI